MELLRILSFVLLFYFTSSINVCTEDCGHTNEFRHDYIYIPEVNAYMKFHDKPTNWHTAKRICRLEDAELASPLDFEIKNALAFFAGQLPAIKAVHTGFSSMYLPGSYTTVKGVPLHEVVPRTWAKGEPNGKCKLYNCLALNSNGDMLTVNLEDHYPFVCIKKDDRAFELNHCKYQDKAYKHVDSLTGICYKFHTTPQPWQQAVATCYGEGGHIATVNSRRIADFLKDVASKSTVFGSYSDKKVYLVGFYRNTETGEWLTMFDQTLEQSGFAQWNSNAPGKHYCGGCSKSTGNLLDVDCNQPNGFICQISKPKGFPA